MVRRGDERVPPITPQLAWRVAVLGAIAFLLFATVFFRLWSLQVLSGSRFVAHRPATTGAGCCRSRRRAGTSSTATTTSWSRRGGRRSCRSCPASLPAGGRKQGDDYHAALSAAERARLDAEARSKALERQLRDDGRRSTTRRAGECEAAARRASAGQGGADPAAAPTEPELAKLYRRIGRVLEIQPATVHERVIRGLAEAPYANITIRTDVPRAEFDYMRERPEQFPGVVITDTFLREYPHGSLAAQLFGTVSQSSKGTSGLEQHYDDVPARRRRQDPR